MMLAFPTTLELAPTKAPENSCQASRPVRTKRLYGTPLPLRPASLPNTMTMTRVVMKGLNTAQATPTTVCL